VVVARVASLLIIIDDAAIFTTRASEILVSDKSQREE
jgi:hypothetical protein